MTATKTTTVTTARAPSSPAELDLHIPAQPSHRDPTASAPSNRPARNRMTMALAAIGGAAVGVAGTLLFAPQSPDTTPAQAPASVPGGGTPQGSAPDAPHQVPAHPRAH